MPMPRLYFETINEHCYRLMGYDKHICLSRQAEVGKEQEKVWEQEAVSTGQASLVGQLAANVTIA